ncbi:hypothetical protein DFH08DRAFT_136820 [Mycena albidolilacea]|uniref:F-box domain-containing protein n=1 Tax=Mycena albidolilacea TaxID=1033008 RepID=A0AAD7A453_9AGAR|nr:hypothetical protein DFH08DRAFT_136820 [Mycena albidolilacea]
MASALAHCVECGNVHSARAALIPSPFQPIIAQQLMPTASEKAAIRDLLRETDADIVRLLCEVAELRHRSEHHRAIIAPIRRVPPEIMAEVFLQLTALEAEAHSQSQDFLGQNYLVRPVVNKAPLIFCGISRGWRAIALSTPRLWNSLSLRFKNKPIPTSVSLCEMWLQRSGSLPLSIQLYPRSYTFWPTKLRVNAIDDCQDLMKTILRFAKRWRWLDLDRLPTCAHDVLNDLAPGSVPILETLLVRHRAPPANETAESTPWERLRVAPKLRHLYFAALGRANITTGGEQSTFPWSQLTHIDVGDCSVDDCLQILNQASTAVGCRFAITRPSAQEHHPILHSELRVLHIQVDWHGTSLGLLWSCLACTVLSTLSVQGDRVSTGLPSFITRTGRTIEELTLTSSNLDDDQFMSCLRDMPLLRRLRVTEIVSEIGPGVQFTNQVWTSLTPPRPLVPNLESLDVSGMAHSSHKLIVRMLESRLGAGDGQAPKLKAVTLSFWRHVSDSAILRLDAFGERGVKMSVERMNEGEEEGSEASDSETEDENSDLQPVTD